MNSFDPYHIWLGIPPEDQPPSHYRLLGIPELESNPDVIDTAAERQTVFLRTFQAGDQVELAEKLLNEVSASRVCLLSAEQKAEYDQQLQAELQPAPAPAPAPVQNDPLGIVTEQPTPSVRQPSRRRQKTQPIWQQPRMLAVAGGAVAVILLLVVLNSGRDKPNPIRNPKERKAELQRLTEEKAQRDQLVAAKKDAAEESAAEKVAAGTALTFKGHSHVSSVSFSPDGKRIVSGSEDKTIKVWDAKTAEQILTLKGHSSIVRRVAFTPDGKQIVSGSDDKTIKVWDAESGKVILTLKGHSKGVFSVAFSPDGKRIVSGSRDFTAKVWDAETGQEILTFKGHSKEVLSVAFSPDGKRIVSGSRDLTAKVWDAETGQEILTLKGHSHYVMSAAFSPDGKRIISGSNDKTIKVWDAESGKVILRLNGHSNYVYNAVFSLDGKWIASGSEDQTVRVWDAKTGQHIRTLKGHTGYISSVAFSPDGKRIASSSNDQTIKIWTLPDLGPAPAQPVSPPESQPDSTQLNNDPQPSVTSIQLLDKMRRRPEMLFTGMDWQETWLSISSRANEKTVTIPLPEMEDATDYALTFGLQKYGRTTGVPALRLGFPISGGGHLQVLYYWKRTPVLVVQDYGETESAGELIHLETAKLKGHATLLLNVNQKRISVSLDDHLVGSFDTPQSKPGLASQLPNIRIWARAGSQMHFRVHKLNVTFARNKSVAQGSSSSTGNHDFKEGLVAYYPFNGNTNDESENGYHITEQDVTIANGDKALISVGRSFEATISSLPSSNMPRTLALTLIPESRAAQPQMICYWGTPRTLSCFGVSFWNGKAYRWLAYPSDIPVTCGLLRETHLVLAYDGAMMSFYQNGTLVLREELTLQTAAGDRFHLGSRTDNHSEFHGMIDDVRIYNRALSAAEVKALYEYEKP